MKGPTVSPSHTMFGPERRPLVRTTTIYVIASLKYAPMLVGFAVPESALSLLVGASEITEWSVH